MKKSKVLSLMTCVAVLSSSFALLPADSVKAASPITLKWYIIGNGQAPDQAKVDAKISEYLQKKKHLNVKLDVQCIDWGNYSTKLNTMTASGENFDICFTASWANNYLQQSVKGAFVPLNKYFDTELKGTVKALGKNYLKATAINGKNYAVPTNKEHAHQWGVILLKKYVDKYKINLKKIKTFEDLGPVFATIHKNEPQLNCLEATQSGGQNPYLIMDYDRIGDDGAPGVVDNNTKDFKVYNEMTTKKYMDWLKVTRKFFLAGYMRKDAATLTDPTGDQKAGKTFCIIESLKPGKDAEMSTSTGQKWVQVALTPPVVSNRDTSGSLQAVSATSKHKLEAIKFLEIVNTDPYVNNLMNFGIEGVHYTKVNDSQIKLTTKNAKQSLYNPGAAWSIANQFIQYTYSNESKDKWKQFLAFNASSKDTKTLGFVFDPNTVKTEWAACNAVWTKYMAMLWTGSVDPKVYLPKAVQAFKDAGSDKVIKEKQKQLNAWMKKNGVKASK